jgi:hypothetical protein
MVIPTAAVVFLLLAVVYLEQALLHINNMDSTNSTNSNSIHHRELRGKIYRS